MDQAKMSGTDVSLSGIQKSRDDASVKIVRVNEILTPWQERTRSVEDAFAPDYDRCEWQENVALNVMSQDDQLMLTRGLTLIQANGQIPRALVAGTATGREVLMLAEAGLNIDGVDISAEYLKLTGAKLSRAGLDDPNRVKLVNSTIERFLSEQPEGKYACISCLFSVLNLLEDWQQALGSFARVLAPGGVLVFSTYGASTARVFTALEQKSLPYDPAILIRKIPGGISLGEGGEVLNACFPEPREVLRELRAQGLRVAERTGFLNYLSIVPRDPLRLFEFVELVAQLEPKLAERMRGQSYNAVIDLLRETDRAIASNPDRLSEFAYLGYVVVKDQQ